MNKTEKLTRRQRVRQMLDSRYDELVAELDEPDASGHYCRRRLPDGYEAAIEGTMSTYRVVIGGDLLVGWGRGFDYLTADAAKVALAALGSAFDVPSGYERDFGSAEVLRSQARVTR